MWHCFLCVIPESRCSVRFSVRGFDADIVLAYIILNIAISLNLLLLCLSPSDTAVRYVFQGLSQCSGPAGFDVDEHIYFSCGCCMLGIRRWCRRTALTFIISSSEKVTLRRRSLCKSFITVTHVLLLS